MFKMLMILFKKNSKICKQNYKICTNKFKNKIVVSYNHLIKMMIVTNICYYNCNISNKYKISKRNNFKQSKKCRQLNRIQKIYT